MQPIKKPQTFKRKLINIVFTVSCKQIQNVSFWMTSCAEPEAVPCALCVCICVCDRGHGETLTAERYDVTATGEHGITHRYRRIRTHKPLQSSPRGLCVDLMRTVVTVIRWCLYTSVWHGSDLEDRRARVSSRHPQLLRPSSAAGLRRSVAVCLSARIGTHGEQHIMLRVVQPEAPAERALEAGAVPARTGAEPRGHGLQPAAHQRQREHRR